ncbi:MAG: hypothetical protein KGK17_01280 [Betaproteobacteria bacterium]|nr:hypothetical protein [Betaproteobacteria bacterium]
MPERVLAHEHWRRGCNESRPHSALGYMIPAEFAAAGRTQPAATDPVDIG